MQSPQNELKELVRDWLDLELPETCVAGDSYTRLSITEKDNRLEFKSKCRGQTKTYLVATVNGDEIEFSTEHGQVREWISTAQFCIGKTLQRY